MVRLRRKRAGDAAPALAPGRARKGEGLSRFWRLGRWVHISDCYLAGMNNFWPARSLSPLERLLARKTALTLTL